MENNIKLYGQAEYSYAVSREILDILVKKDIPRLILHIHNLGATY